ncbi:hypothetical protein KUG12_00070 [Streptomyces sp. BV333]|uniref:rolling circle replication-associated protein n=1 Tax=Streptomyces sp. BV333 TaxID=2849673 RepID=UPI001C2E13E6|nr:hypothetical protein [Streptomyces sp. BV333]MBV1952785.1 hypothetical protein [Streptomyces sp. BV333]
MDAAAARLASTASPLAWLGWEGPRARLIFGPGMIQLTRADAARRERSAARQQAAATTAATTLATWLVEGQRDGEDAEAYEARMGRVSGALPLTEREITEWSRKSRANMIKTLASLDWTPMYAEFALPAMTTLTYPGDWLAVAPDGKTAKRHLEAFLKRFQRAWGAEWLGVWKFEFQRRGAPHFHLLSVPPPGTAGAAIDAAYRERLDAYERGEVARKPRRRTIEHHGLGYKEWLSATWNDIVFAEVEEDMTRVEEEAGYPDPRRDHLAEQKRRHLGAGTNVSFEEGAKASDPKRLAVYFAKHGSFKAKEYQHIVPAEWQEPGKGPGRFWGYRGVQKLTREVELAPGDYLFVARTMRRLRARVQVWDPATRTHRWTKATRVTEVTRYAEGVRPAWSGYSEVIGLAGAAYMEPVKARRRKVRRPVTRFSRGAGFAVENDAPELVETLTRALVACRGPEVQAARRSEEVRQVVRRRRLNRVTR